MEVIHQDLLIIIRTILVKNFYWQINENINWKVELNNWKLN